jgi:hypothetical protein
LRIALLATAVGLCLPPLAVAQGGYETGPTREQFAAQADELCGETYPQARKLARKFAKFGRDGALDRHGAPRERDRDPRR